MRVAGHKKHQNKINRSLWSGRAVIPVNEFCTNDFFLEFECIIYYTWKNESDYL